MMDDNDVDDDMDGDEYNITCDASISLIKSPLCIGRALLHDCVDHNSHKYSENLLPCCEWG
jgi:hypothetical protein